MGWLAVAGGLTAGISLWPARAAKAVKRWVAPKGTPPDSLKNREPKEVDSRNLEVTPLKNFSTMGLTDHSVNLKTWRLKIDGAVKKPMSFSYEELLKQQSFIRKVLLICPGVFAYVGNWKGFAIAPLLEKAGLESGVTHIFVFGPDGPGGSSKSFPLKEIQEGKVFLAFGANGVKLPQKHGFPLRIVAEDYLGGDWIKYVSRITAIGNKVG